MRRLLLPLFAALLLSCGGSDGGPSTGVAIVVIHTTGAELDPNGYMVNVTGAAAAAATDQDTLLFDDLAAGAHAVTVSGVAANCTLPAPDTLHVVESEADILLFTIPCVATSGTLAVKLVTGGVALDPDGYAVTIDAGSGTPIAVNGTTTAAALAVGPHTVALSGVVMNCAPDSAGPYPINITPGAADTLTLSIDCAWPRVAVRIGSGGIVLVNPDGSNPVSVPLPAGFTYDQQAWSADRSQLAVRLIPSPVTPPQEIAVVDPATAPTDSVVPDPLMAFGPRWRPDGSGLLELREDITGKLLGVFSVDLATNARVKISPDSFAVESADWSPDGTQVAFVAWVNGDSTPTERLYVVQANGSGVTRISPDSLSQIHYVRWSPAGDRILFNRNNGELWTVSPVGTGVQRTMVAGYSLKETGTWSPDGSSLMVGAVDTLSGGYALLRISPAGTILGTLPRPGGVAWLDPDWR